MVNEPFTIKQLENRGLLTELANVFRDAESARELLEAVGYPREEIPVLSSDTPPIQFWRRVAEQIDYGIIHGENDLRRLLAAAAERYPGNEIFAPWRHQDGDTFGMLDEGRLSSRRLFIGSSPMGRPVAEALRECLDEDFEIEICNQGTFGLSQGNIFSLISASKRFDFAVIALMPGDLVTNNSSIHPSPRDNVILEIGFFLGVLGHERTYIVYDRTVDLKLPADLAGVSCATFSQPTHGNLTGAVGAACMQIRRSAKIAHSTMIPSPKTPTDEWTQTLVQSALKVVCRALETPLSAEIAKLRAFIFKKEDSQLVCTHFWAPRPVKEVVGALTFRIDSKTAEQVAVVKAALQKRVVAVEVSTLPKDLGGFQGEVDDDICFVLAAPILSSKGEVWGTVDIDASSQEGAKLLRQET